ncbi:chromo domain-containing protein [Trichonephila clavipes]|nr:chromo domain-containing protein [Trichonephila clavipes]
MFRVFTHRNSYKYLDILKPLVDSYNNSVHRSHGFAPANVTEADEPQLYKLLYKIDSPIRFRFAVNDVVRISKARKLFRKGYLPGWTEETFIIYKRYPTNPPTYVLQDLSGKEIAGRFYTEELQKIDKSDNDLWAIEKIIRKKGRGTSRQLFVKWVGFDDSFKSRMAENMTDFHILLPSNSSMQYFPDNSPNHFRTKLSRPITLNGEWECCLSEVTLPGKYFTIQPRYNDFYTVTREIEVPDETLLSTFDISFYNEDHEDFVAGFNANMKNIYFYRSSIGVHSHQQ